MKSLFCALAALPLLSLMLSGCVVSTAAHVVTAPVRVAAKGVDWATTSQDEADRNRGRRERKEEEKRAKEARKAAKANEDRD
jgi:hypothetical protein